MDKNKAKHTAAVSKYKNGTLLWILASSVNHPAISGWMGDERQTVETLQECAGLQGRPYEIEWTKRYYSGQRFGKVYLY